MTRTIVASDDIQAFAMSASGHALRPYQLDIATAIINAVLTGQPPRMFAVLIARQGGKNQTQAVIEAFLLNYCHDQAGAHIVKAAPTFKPQVITSIMRLAEMVEAPVEDLDVARERGYMIRVGRARISFFSAAPEANVVSASATLLLEADEAQDIDEDKWNRDFMPMAAANDAVVVLWGTAWTSRTLLARVKKQLLQDQRADGLRRVFEFDWRVVAETNVRYGVFVRREMRRLGQDHPMIQTQYCLKTADEHNAMFPARRLERMRGAHQRRRKPAPGRRYVILVDVGGESAFGLSDPASRAGARFIEPRRDSTVFTVVESLMVRGQPVFHTVDRRVLTGAEFPRQLDTLFQLDRLWKPERVVMDATGMGASVASFARQQLGNRLTPFVFTGPSKSRLGWAFLALVDTDRYKEYRDDGAEDTAMFWRQAAEAEMQLRDESGDVWWGVRDPKVHDDVLVSAALCAALVEEFAPRRYVPSVVIEAEEVDWDAGGF